MKDPKNERQAYFEMVRIPKQTDYTYNKPTYQSYGIMPILMFILGVVFILCWIL